MNREDFLLQNVQNLQKALCAAQHRSRHHLPEADFMAVTKYAADEDVLFLLEKGLIRHIGESRIQQAEKRWTRAEFIKYTAVKKHFIGHLQKNKAAKAARLFDFIDSLDCIETARILSEKTHPNKTIRVMVQIKLTDKNSQTGLPLTEARMLAKELQTLPRLKVCGYMAIAPQNVDEKTLRRLFGEIKKAFDEDFPSGTERYLSLGMSEDFYIAVEEGSSLPRVGSKLFAENLEGL